MTGFVYKWTNIINGKWYIGSHKGTIDDGYRHSSEILRHAEEKYGLENFVREILFEGNYKEDGIKAVESQYLQKYQAATNSESYNLSNISGPNCYSEETNRKRSQAMKGMPRPYVSLALKGRKQTSEHNQKKGKALRCNAEFCFGLIVYFQYVLLFVYYPYCLCHSYCL